jgi:hypothetical protein
MIRRLKTLALTMALLAGSVLAGTQAEIDHLLNFVANTSCQYDRNGTIHDGPEARDQINIKFVYHKKKFKTTEDFIKFSATKSMMSGKKYKIRCPDSEAVFASDWLLDELKTFRENGEK